MTTFKLPAEAKKEIRTIYHSERDAYVHQYVQRHLREREELIEVHPVSLVRLQDFILAGYRVSNLRDQEIFIPGSPMMRVLLDRPQHLISEDRAELEAQAEADLVDEITNEITATYEAQHRAAMEAKNAAEAAALKAEAPTMRDRIRAVLTDIEVS